MALEQFSQIIPAQRNYVYHLIKLFEVERLFAITFVLIFLFSGRN